ncbi:MAG: hypothetical protein M3024_12300 [Candidatus Dormibacteraeota bacterium]|nr:hypothetical protein [Candidatus Dormibacteraeota bacterium]
MTIGPERAAQLARSEAGRADEPAQVWAVRRLSSPQGDYLLVVLGADGGATGLAAVRVADGEVLSWAVLDGSRPHLSVDAAAAIQLSGLGPDARGELVWVPSALSQSPLYPFWSVTDGERTRYVDLQGGAWDAIEPGGRGGAPTKGGLR